MWYSGIESLSVTATRVSYSHPPLLPLHPTHLFFPCRHRSHLSHDHLIPRHTTHDHQRHLEHISRYRPNLSPTPITLILPAIPNRIHHPARAPRGANASANDRICNTATTYQPSPLISSPRPSALNRARTYISNPQSTTPPASAADAL